MAPRRSEIAPSAAQAVNPPAGVEQLPDDLLIKIMWQLTWHQRRVLRGEVCRLAAPAAQCLPAVHNTSAVCFLTTCRQAAALVSQRWHRCAFAPEFIDLVRLNAVDPQEERLASFCRWLQRHGRHVQALSLAVLPSRDAGHDAAIVESAGPQLAACLAVVAAVAEKLETLTLAWHLSEPLFVAAWASQLPSSLRQLNLLSRSELRITSSLGSLTQLTQLNLQGNVSCMLAEGVSLPPLLLDLAIVDGASQVLPGQASRSGILAWFSMTCSRSYSCGACKLLTRPRLCL